MAATGEARDREQAKGRGREGEMRTTIAIMIRPGPIYGHGGVTRAESEMGIDQTPTHLLSLRGENTDMTLRVRRENTLAPVIPDVCSEDILHPVDITSCRYLT